MVSFRRVQHVSIPAPPDSHPTTRAFYGELLGMRELSVPSSLDRDRLVWYAAGDDEIHVFSHEREERHPAQHLCLQVDDLDGLLARLEERGHAVDRNHPTIPNRPRAFVRDPYGNSIELTEFRDDDRR